MKNIPALSRNWLSDLMPRITFLNLGEVLKINPSA
jgi:hypothetical protein